ncbi:pyridoxal phosphate phosphatase PHOSPHO2 [Cephus cinctus]|uniref:Pyridoxal phosphate phosphatase PHOSPHO2 n=1 Tax=Cephus cinctus TaxID=211228 RepID=A0AAJ7FHM8_CEPCN|nr:pyridoxal phosphate phosphatase PHOSPHO2 [Cephus cinctus]
MFVRQLLKTQLHLKFLSKMSRPLLVAFDFDHTIVDDNTDIVVRKLLPEEKLPDSVRGLYRSDGWTAYMRKIFELLHANGISLSQIDTAIQNILPVAGIETLLHKLHDSNCEIIIISDSNSLLISTWLKHKKLDNLIAQVFTNPAWANENGMMCIDMYHVQDWCKLSTKNLCKGHILEEYIKKRFEDGVQFEKIMYVGDGRNDLCPILRLSENDIAFPRKEYALIKILNDPQSEKGQSVKAQVYPWNNATDILHEIIQKVNL